MNITLEKDFNFDEIFLIALIVGMRQQEVKRRLEDYKFYEFVTDPLENELTNIDTLFNKLNGLLASIKGKND
jgi:hypothetical protein